MFAFLTVALGLFLSVVSGNISSPTDPLYVTPYLPTNYEKAQNLSSISLKGWNGVMHSGFFTIDETVQSNTFFWYSEAMNGNKDAPILLWLQGGPGASSLFGLFTEVGPFNIDVSGNVVKRKISWNQDHHMLFLDNPVGTGFSFTNDPSGFATNQTTVGLDLYEALRQFFELFPKLRKNDFYVTGESYAGKYVPSCAYTIHTMNSKKPIEEQINLKGISIGDGAMDPASQLGGNFGDLLYNLGMVDFAEREVFHDYQKQIAQHVQSGDPVSAFHVFDEMLNGDLTPYPTYYANVTGMKTNYFNFEQSPDGSSLSNNYFIDWLNTSEARRAVHVGDIPYAVLNSTVEKYLLHDWFVGVVDFLVPIMENYKVLVYSGQNDIILGPPLTEAFLRDLDWSGKDKFQKAKKQVWTIETGTSKNGAVDLAGYVKYADRFTYAVVRGAGHMVPGDQPERAIDLISQFIKA
jgi:vitellogenic carboxypeptidase-like protein